jgi:uncharacterized protein (DUF1778 family)
VRRTGEREPRVGGVSPSEFILGAARREAEAVVLDSRLFALDARSFGHFVSVLDGRPPVVNRGLQRLLSVTSPWRR